MTINELEQLKKGTSKPQKRFSEDFTETTTKEYEVEVVTRGNCMICGKELTEGLFFCKECESKAREEGATVIAVETDFHMPKMNWYKRWKLKLANKRRLKNVKKYGIDYVVKGDKR